MARKTTRTQDRIQSILGDVKLPREIVSDLFANVERGRANLLKTVSREVTHIFAKIDVQKVMEEVLRHHRIRFSAIIEFEPKNKSRKVKRNG